MNWYPLPLDKVKTNAQTKQVRKIREPAMKINTHRVLWFNGVSCYPWEHRLLNCLTVQIGEVYKGKTDKLNIQRPSCIVIVMSFRDICMLSLRSSVWFFRFLKYTGSLGVESAAVSFSNMNTVDDMSGLAFGSSWTHNSPIWIHRRTSWSEQFSTMDESTNSLAFPSFHKLHA
jgi:hypothetical protein